MEWGGGGGLRWSGGGGGGGGLRWSGGGGGLRWSGGGGGGGPNSVGLLTPMHMMLMGADQPDQRLQHQSFHGSLQKCGLPYALPSCLMF